MKTILITGGAGFIGSNFILKALQDGLKVVNLDKLTYSGNLDNLCSISLSSPYVFVKGDIGNNELVEYLLDKYDPDCIVNFAAESHVDRSIASPRIFFETNVLGTEQLLETTKRWLDSNKNKSSFKFIHISTDEVYGSLELEDPSFTEESQYLPNSPYSSSKASSDLLARSFFETFGFPVIITNCSNNYGPRQYPEKLIPLVISNCLQNKEIPIYGTGTNIRDWLYVDDHCEAILEVIRHGQVGEKYNIGGGSEKTNKEVVAEVCSVLDELHPSKYVKHYSELQEYVTDRPGHDKRYAIDFTKINQLCGWVPKVDFSTGIRKTVKWYLNNLDWLNRQEERRRK
jgi:hypothetical protein